SVVVDKNAVGVHDVDLFGVFVEVKEENAVGEYVRVLIILLLGLHSLARLGTRSAMAELPEELSIARKLHDGVAAGAARNPNVSFAIHQNAVFGAGSRGADCLPRASRAHSPVLPNPGANCLRYRIRGQL